jgi:hypothetical protein
MVLANVRNAAEQHHLLRAVATADRPREAATGGAVETGESCDVMALASDLEAGRPLSEPRITICGIRVRERRGEKLEARINLALASDCESWPTPLLQ